MAITDKNSVLIIGAGASVPFGMPLGGDLMKVIHKQISDEYDYNQAGVGRGLSGGPDKLPIFNAINKYNDQQENDSQIRNKLYNLKSLLLDQTSETIDDFIVENSSYAEATKLCISAIFFKRMYINYDGYQFNLNPISARNLANDLPEGKTKEQRNWVHLLINIIRQGIREGKISENNKVQIISFNYDMILEYILDQQFSNSEHMAGKDWRDYLVIIHPHGRCADFKKVLLQNNAIDFIVESALGIHVINQANVPDAIIQARENAKEIIANAREIYATGFAFAGPNCKMLGLDRDELLNKQRNKKNGDALFQREFKVCNFDGNMGLSLALGKLRHVRDSSHKVPQIIINEQRGMNDRPLGVTDWIKMGVLGELPG